MNSNDEKERNKRHEILRTEILKYTNDGYYVITQSDFAAQLKKPKEFSWFWAALWALFTLGPGIFVYLIYFFVIKKDSYKYLSIGENIKGSLESGLVETI